MKKNIILKSTIPYLEVQRHKKDRDYTSLIDPVCFVLKSKLKVIKQALLEGKTVEQCNCI